MKVVEKYIKFVNNWKYYILLFWLIITITTAIYGSKFISNTTQQFGRPNGSNAEISHNNLIKYFNDFAFSSNIALYVQRYDGSDVTGDDFRNYTLLLNESLASIRHVISFQSYYTLLKLHVPQPIAAKEFLAPSKKSSIIAITLSLEYEDKSAGDVADQIVDKSNKILQQLQNNEKSNGLFVVSTGLPAWLKTMIDQAERDMAVMDAIVLPIAFLVLAYVIRSMRLLTITLTTVGISISTTFGCLNFVTLHVQPVISSTPSIMMSILIAMSIDYQLFLLSRFRECIVLDKLNVEDAVIKMMSSAGETIIVSGLTLNFCFWGLLLIPLMMIQSIGVCCAVAILITLFVNITVTPSLLLTFPNFYEKCGKPFNMNILCCKKDSTNENSPLIHSTGMNYTVIESSTTKQNIKNYDTVDNNDVDDENINITCWHKLGNIVTKPSYAILIVIFTLGLVTPFAIHAFQVDATDKMSLALPRGSKVTEAYEDMVQEFGYGSTSPYQLLIVPPNNMKIMTKQFFEESQHLLQKFVETTEKTNIQNLMGVMYTSGIPVDIQQYNCSISDPNPEKRGICIAAKMSEHELVNDDQTATIVMIGLDFDPLGKDGWSWYTSALNSFENIEKSNPGWHFYLAGMNSDSNDNIHVVYQQLPKMIAITLSVVLVFVGISFKSIAIPLRSVLTIILTLLFVYGLCSLIFIYDIFGWLNFAALSGDHSIYWISPCTIFAISVGIALDYDIFLMVRIREARYTLDLDDRHAIIYGLVKTGRIITAAGMIMSIAFAGLLLSNMKVLNEIGCYLVFGVLFDTFIIRSLFAPAIMSLLGIYNLNWWPSKAPEVDNTEVQRSDYYRKLSFVL